MVKIENFTKEINLKSKGVYLIEHKSTKIKYVGSTVISFRHRWLNHLAGLLRGNGNAILLNICNKYGIEGFSFKILCRMDNNTEEEIRLKEKYYIDCLDTYNNGANLTLDTFCSLSNIKRKKYTEEDRLKYMYTNTTRKKVYVYNEDGMLLHVFPSTVACDRFFGLKKGSTSWVINHPLRSILKKFYPSFLLKEWIPKEEKKLLAKKRAEKIAKIRKKNSSYEVSEEQKNKIRLSNKSRKRVALYDLDGKFVKKFNSLNECDDFLNLYRGTTSKVFRGLTKILRKKYIPKLI